MVAGGSCGRRTSPPTPSPAERGAAGEKMSASGLWTLAPLSCGRGAGGEVRGTYANPSSSVRADWPNDEPWGLSRRPAPQKRCPTATPLPIGRGSRG
jgi:hypothetical protein